MKKIHPLQKKILEIANKYDLQKMSLGQIARFIGESYAQTAKYHVLQLKKKGLLDKALKPCYPNLDSSKKEPKQKLISLPIIGAANCGQANLIAEENIEGFLQVSPKIVGNKDQLFVLRTEGDSMNKADVYGRNIEDGDYVLVDGADKTLQANKYIASIIDGMANIKRVIHDQENSQIILYSESTEKYPPIYIHKEDFSTYVIAGTVIQVLKPPKTEEINYEAIKE